MTHALRLDRRGMTLLEMMMALTIFTVVLGGAMAFMRSQSRGFRIGADRAALIQNLRYAADYVAQDLRTAGANVPDEQPVVIYAGANAFAFNADYATTLASDPFSVYYDPDAPTGSTSALIQSQADVLPGTDMTYPDTSYRALGGINSAAETITFFFALDTTTARLDDYMLYRQVNHLQREVVSRNLLPTTGVAFFQFYRKVTPGNAPQYVDTVPSNLLPLKHTQKIHLSPTDTGTAARIDSIVAVRVNFTVTNGRTGAEERTRAITRLVWLPNAGKAVKLTCGDEPQLGAVVLLGLPDTLPGAQPFVNLTWSAATDEASGQKDVVRYVLWKRLLGATDWGETYASIPAGLAAEPAPQYAFVDEAIDSATTYQYALAAQDCTPKTSTLATATVVVP